MILVNLYGPNEDDPIYYLNIFCENLIIFYWRIQTVSTYSKSDKRNALPVYNIKTYKKYSRNSKLQLTVNDQLFSEVILMEIRGNTISHHPSRRKNEMK